MEFNLSEERQQLTDMLQRFVRKDYGFEARKKIVASKEGFSREVWGEFASLGLLGIGIPEAHGGMGGDAVDTSIVMEAIGSGLLVEPYFSTVVLCGGALRDCAAEAQKAELLPAIASGELLMAFAHHEPGGRHEIERVATKASRNGAGYALSGAKSVVLHGDSADRFLVSARTSGTSGDRDGISLFLVDANAPGLKRRAYPTRDEQRAADLTLENVVVDAAALVGDEGRAYEAIERAVDNAIAALCAEAVGCMEALNTQTLEYLKTRKQFGVPIGSFQVLKHRMADMFIHAAQARSMALLAAIRVSEGDAAERRRAISAAKALVGQSSRFVGQQAVQLHGGMGVTDELPVSHYFRRLTAINATFGDVDYHLARFGESMRASD